MKKAIILFGFILILSSFLLNLSVGMENDYSDSFDTPTNFITNLKIGEKVGYLTDDGNNKQWVMFKVNAISTGSASASISVQAYVKDFTTPTPPNWAGSSSWWDDSQPINFLLNYQYGNILNALRFVFPRDLNWSFLSANAPLTITSGITWLMSGEDAIDVFNETMTPYDSPSIIQTNYSNYSNKTTLDFNTEWFIQDAINPNYNASIKSILRCELNYRNVVEYLRFSFEVNKTKETNEVINKTYSQKLYYQSNPMDTTPVISFTNPRNFTKSQNFSFKIEDQDVGINPTYMIYDNSTSIENGTWISGTSYSIPISKLTEGNHTIKVIVCDDMGHEETFNCEIIINVDYFWWYIGIYGIGGSFALALGIYIIVKIIKSPPEISQYIHNGHTWTKKPSFENGWYKFSFK